MAPLCQIWRPDRGRCFKTYGIIFVLFTDLVLQSVNGYLSSPHVGKEPPYPRESQHAPVITSPVVPAAASAPPPGEESYTFGCPSGGLCQRLPADCMLCNFQHNCTYAKATSFTCRPRKGVHCIGESGQQQTNFSLSISCRFCWQLDPSQYRCFNSTSCMTVSCPRRRYNATCDVLDHVHCLGRRSFQKRLYCNWTGGYKWSTSLALSITLGGFGADRFYLGQWREGLGKLFSFGGLGIWTLIDVLLIGVGYVGPADGSLYI
ncbi:TM2 domain-containing protein 3 [Pseudochaenichthys georgianus]|uniref:TM2 domain-containing protein 3 n=1 Tax=Pseudochaenichthys georgianus TaxID=52239 RepID=UPI00146CB718|nr:TM2 domain-containing protein 3 [Pseudochaenichthys georgianus]